MKTSIRFAIGASLVAVGLLFSMTISYPVKAYAQYDQACELAGANSTMIRDCITNYLQFENMSKTSYRSMQSDLDHERNQIRHDQVLQNATQTGEYKSSESSMAKQMLNNDLQERQWYNDWTQNQEQKMMNNVKYWEKYDHNPTPQPNCPAWHECGANGIPLNQTQFEMEIQQQKAEMQALHENNTIPTTYLKPEMYSHPSGIISQIDPIKNWQSLETWMMQHQNSTSTH